jgi:hypothetical protein
MYQNHTLRVEITFGRVEITEVSVVIKMRVEITLERVVITLLSVILTRICVKITCV